MKRTIAIKIKGSQEKIQALLELQEAFSQGCNLVQKIAFENKENNRIRLHHLAYETLRKEIPALGSQMACNAIAKVSATHKALKFKREANFKKNCSVHFDKRTYSLKDGILSLRTLQGRIQFDLEIGPFQINYLLQGIVKEAELVRKGKTWYFNLVLDLPDPPLSQAQKMIAVDFGENTVAACSTGKLYGGGTLKAQRDKYLAHRKRLQSNGSQSAKQKLRQISGRERRHVRHVNHCIAKDLVKEAKIAGASVIILEDLKNIRKRIKAGKKLRCRLHRWPFDQLRSFVEYKAAAEGIKVVYVNPAFSSQTCSACGSLGQRTKHRFECSSCGSRQHSDLNASRNHLRLGASADAPTGTVNCRNVAA